MDQNAATSIRLATLYLLPKMEAFLLARRDFVRTMDAPEAERLYRELCAMSEMASAAITDVTLARIRALASEPFLASPADTMPRILVHSKGINGHTQEFRDIIVHR